MPEFIPGRELSAAYYEGVVAPLLRETTHSAAFLGFGSDVLGFDTERSTDHGWGPRIQIFVATGDVEGQAERMDARLPDRFRGWPTRYGWDAVPVTHHVKTTTLAGFLIESLGFDPRPVMSIGDWLTTPQQLLLGVTSGAVFHDGLGELLPLRAALEWYPFDVWLWLLACQWQRLEQEEPFVGRAAEVGDELGSRVLAARLARDVMRLCFLMERRYTPYSKWLGTAFSRLDAAPEIEPPLHRALSARDIGAREQALVEAFEAVARRFNALGITAPEDPTVRPFYGRPFRILGSARFAAACLAAIGDDDIRRRPLIGSIDQFVDSTDVLSSPALTRRFSEISGP